MRPILFNTDEVRAILAGKKTVTRRVVKPQPEKKLIPIPDEKYWIGCFVGDDVCCSIKPPCCPGDILYVRETWCKSECFGLQNGYVYKANDNSILEQTGFVPKWRPSIHMPREAARIFLRVTGVRVERLQEMPPYDIAFEGFRKQKDFIALWNSTIKPSDRALYGWDANPWVWVIEFERISREEALYAD